MIDSRASHVRIDDTGFPEATECAGARAGNALSGFPIVVTLEAVLRVLADGRFHSGEALGASLGVSRAAVCKRVAALRQRFGLEIDTVRGRGYRLAHATDLLEPGRIRAALSPRLAHEVGQLEVLFEIDSTNRWAMSQASAGVPSGYACFAEFQSAGRGRRGRTWVSPMAANLYMSLLWRFANGASALSGLGLVAGLAVVNALDGLGVPDLELKWPNDILWRQRKLGGVLLELGGEASGPCHVVVGVGLNVRLSARAAAAIDQAWVDLAQIGAALPGRNVLAAAVLESLVEHVRDFERSGLLPTLRDWPRWDALRDKFVTVWQGERATSGRALGVDASGALLVQVGERTERFYGGEVSVRADDGARRAN